MTVKKVFLILLIFFSAQGNSQDFFSEDGIKPNKNLEDLTLKSFLIEENSQDTIYIKYDDISTKLLLSRKTEDSINKRIRFVSERTLYDKLIHDYYDVRYFFMDYNIARIGYVNYAQHKIIRLIFYRNTSGDWELLKKSTAKGTLRIIDLVYQLIREKQRENEGKK